MNITREEQLNLLAFLKLVIDKKRVAEGVIKDIIPIYKKMREEYINGR